MEFKKIFDKQLATYNDLIDTLAEIVEFDSIKEDDDGNKIAYWGKVKIYLTKDSSRNYVTFKSSNVDFSWSNNNYWRFVVASNAVLCTPIDAEVGRFFILTTCTDPFDKTIVDKLAILRNANGSSTIYAVNKSNSNDYNFPMGNLMKTSTTVAQVYRMVKSNDGMQAVNAYLTTIQPSDKFIGEVNIAGERFYMCTYGAIKAE